MVAVFVSKLATNGLFTACHTDVDAPCPLRTRSRGSNSIDRGKKPPTWVPLSAIEAGVPLVGVSPSVKG